MEPGRRHNNFNVFVLSKRASKYIKQKLTDGEKRNNKSTTSVVTSQLIFQEIIEKEVKKATTVNI